MSGNSSYANLDSREGNVNGELTITFNFKPRRIIITNDSISGDLEVKFNASESVMTLKPTETVSLDFAHKQMIISGSFVDYRIWGIG